MGATKISPAFAENNTMTSLEIAELTGKQHAHVMRDIRVLLEQGVHQSNFGLMFRISKLGNGAERKDPYYELTPKGILILASGYNVLLREKIINRLEELEQGKVKQITASNKLQDNMAFADWSAKFLNLNDASKLGWSRKIGEKFGLVTDALPQSVNAGTEHPVVHTTTFLLKKYNIGISAIAFNKILERKGIIKEVTRPGIKGVVHKWYVLNPEFDKYGQNLQHFKYQQQTQIKWYDNLFGELLLYVNQ